MGRRQTAPPVQLHPDQRPSNDSRKKKRSRRKLVMAHVLALLDGDARDAGHRLHSQLLHGFSALLL
jgi:hypothetical protein